MQFWLSMFLNKLRKIPAVHLQYSDWCDSKCAATYFFYNQGLFLSTVALRSFLLSQQISQSGNENVWCHRGGSYQLCVFHRKCYSCRCVNHKAFTLTKRQKLTENVQKDAHWDLGNYRDFPSSVFFFFFLNTKGLQLYSAAWIRLLANC